MINIEDRTKFIEDTIKSFLPNEEGFQKILFEGMNYSVLGIGKRLRPIILYTGFKMYEGFILDETERKSRYEIVKAFAAAIEFIHSYSLVHDDLPAMDNDMYRRGRLTTHAKYGEAYAILAGDALLNFAFEIANAAVDNSGKELLKLKSEIVLSVYKDGVKALRLLSEASGCYGMAGGQVVDVMKSGMLSDIEELEFVYRLKTGALLEAAFTIGAVIAGAENTQIEYLKNAGISLGMAFQIQDDILDVYGDETVIGKPIHSDEKNKKTTYVTLFGAEKAKSMADNYSKECIEYLDKLNVSDNAEKEFLVKLVKMLMDRKK